ncbi:hypothetical protein [Deinococcus sp. 12RED42]|uniref:hypothetical protein n=1 Tax=Deinococcus sp. 12RED42 TaxID=2745872 RepID=UPI001E297FA0|nr:hypothetical protein [Deinococcus sp. 12RED42]MCD0164727.1 hypothetical protein [Deinococcus sp. 12RED42]
MTADAPFSIKSQEELVPLMAHQYGWSARVCRDRFAVLRATVLKHERQGFSRPAKVWLVTRRGWTKVQSYLDGYDPNRWPSLRVYLQEHFDLPELEPQLADVIEELRSWREAQVEANTQVQKELFAIKSRLSVIENALRFLPEEIDAALDERRLEEDKRGPSIRDVVEDIRDGLRLVGQAMS